jgi:hypothetical protein
MTDFMKRTQLSLFMALSLTCANALSGPANTSESNSSSTSNAISGQAVQGQTQGFTFAPQSTSTYNNRTISPTMGLGAGVNFPQNFLDPGVSAAAMADPLIWYYLDAMATPCEDDPELQVDSDDYVTVSYQPDCGINRALTDQTPMGEITPRVDYVFDFDNNINYVPLGMITVQANWDDEPESVNLLTLIKSAQRYLRKNMKGFDRIILASDLLKRTVATQRASEADSTAFSVSPSISAGFGRDALVGSLFGFGQSTGTTRPLSRKGATFVVAAVSPGPWMGSRPRISQREYFSRMIALPQQLNNPQPQPQMQNKQQPPDPLGRHLENLPPQPKHEAVNPVLKKPESEEMSHEDIQTKAIQ